jgi:hypothetical protein
MKKIILILIMIVLGQVIIAQTSYTNLIIQKANPVLYLNGTAATIDFYNGDVRITQASDLLSISGANYLKIGSDTVNTKYELRTGLNLKANLANPLFTGLIKLNTDTIATQAYSRAVGGVGGAAVWGAIAGSLSSQIDLTDSLLARYTKTQSIINFASKLHGHIQDSIADLSDSLLARFTKTQSNDLYVPKTLTVNGHALSGNISVTASDINLGNVTNESKATMFTSPVFTGAIAKINTDTLATRSYSRSVGGGGGGTGTWGAIGGTLSNQTDLVDALALKANIASPTFTGTVGGITKAMVGLTNVTDESKATMFTSPALTGTTTIQTLLRPSVSDGAALGSTSYMWSDLFLASGSVINLNNSDVTLTHSSNTLTLGGGNLALGSNNLILTGSIAGTANRVTKGWFTDIESTNIPTVSGLDVIATKQNINDSIDLYLANASEGIVLVTLVGALTDDTPTDTEIDTVTGTTPSVVGAGYQCTIKDNNGSGAFYFIESDGTYWHYFKMTKAL